MRYMAQWSIRRRLVEPCLFRGLVSAGLLSVLFSSSALAHICGPPVTMLPPNGIATYAITADIAESQPSIYQVYSAGNPAVVSVSPVGVFTQLKQGVFTLLGVGAGETDVIFQWSYTPTGRTGLCTNHVIVTTNFILTAANYSLSAFTADPVNAYTGGLNLHRGPDLALRGPMPLEFRREYSSDLSANLLLQSSLGMNWAHNFETGLAAASNRVDVVTYQGLRLQFQKNGSAWQPINSQAMPFQLIQSGANYVLGDRRAHRIDTFDSAGDLISIADGKGNVQTLIYTNNVLIQVTDGLGRVLNFTYTGFQHLYTVDDGARTVYYFVDETNPEAPVLADIFDAASGLTTYTYDTNQPSAALLTAETLPEGNAPVTQSYDTNGHVIAQGATGVYTNRFAYGANGSSTTVTNALGHTHSYTHDSGGHLGSYTDEAGVTVTVQSTTNGQRAAVIDRLGNATSFAYDPVSRQVATITNADNTLTQLTYTNYTVSGITFYDVSQVTHPDGSTEQFIRDAVGNVVTYIDRAGQRWLSTWNGHGQMLTFRSPMGGVSTFTYNPDGTLASSTDSDVGTTHYGYDAMFRPNQLTHPDGAVAQAVYDNLDRLILVTDENTNSSTFGYNADSLLTNAVDANSASRRFNYDSLNRLTIKTDTLGNSASAAYDALGNAIAATNRNGNHVAFGFNILNRLTTVTDATSNTFRFGVNSEALTVSASDPLGHSNSVHLDSLGYSTVLTNPLGFPSGVSRDSLRQITSYTDELQHATQIHYDSRSRATNITCPQIGSVGVSLNPLGQVQQLTDFNGQNWSWGYTPMGRFETFRDPLGYTTRLSYNPRGDLATLTYPDGLTRSNAYDAAGNLTEAKYSDGTDLTYGYTSANRLAFGANYQIAYDSENRITNILSWGVNFASMYDPGARLTTLWYSNGLFSVSYVYNAADRLVRVGDTLSLGWVAFGYNPAGALTNITRANGIATTLTLDPLNRLMRIQDGTFIDLQRTFTLAGLPLQQTYRAPLDPAQFTMPASINWSINAASQLTSPGYAYDLQGRQTSAPGHTFRYTGPWLTQIDSVALGFNGMSDLSTRSAGGVTTWYLYNYSLGFSPGAFVGEYNVTSNKYMRYWVRTPGGQPLYYIDPLNGNQAYYLHYDFAGHTLALTDNSGLVTDSYAYTPYGQLLAHSGTSTQPFTAYGQFNGRYEPAANLIQLGYRFYDPFTTRFLSRDPDWPNLSFPQKLDPYEYPKNNPLTYFPIGAREYSLNFKLGYQFDLGPYEIGRQRPTSLNFDPAPVRAPVQFNFAQSFKYLSLQDSSMPLVSLNTDIPVPAAERVRDSFPLFRAPSCCCCCCCCCCDCCCDCCDCCCCDSGRPFAFLASRLIETQGLFSSTYAVGILPQSLTESFHKFHPMLPFRLRQGFPGLSDPASGAGIPDYREALRRLRVGEDLGGQTFLHF